MLLQIQPPDKDLEGEPVAVSLTKSEVFIYAIPYLRGLCYPGTPSQGTGTGLEFPAPGFGAKRQASYKRQHKADCKVGAGLEWGVSPRERRACQRARLRKSH